MDAFSAWRCVNERLGRFSEVRKASVCLSTVWGRVFFTLYKEQYKEQ